MTGGNKKQRDLAYTGLLIPSAVISAALIVIRILFSEATKDFGGFFNLEALFLSILNVVYIPIFWKRFGSIKGAAVTLMIISGLIIFSALCIAPKQADYLQYRDHLFNSINVTFSYPNGTTSGPMNMTISYLNGTSTPIINGTVYKAFTDSVNQTSSPYYWGFQFNYILGDLGVTTGFLGLFYALISVTVMYIGSRCAFLTKDDARSLIEYSSMLSIIITVMIFAANSRIILVSVTYAFAVMPLLLAVILLATGMLTGPVSSQKGLWTSRGFMTLTISSVVGALFGSLVIPLTKTATNTLTISGYYEQVVLFSRTYYSAPIGIYLFMCSSLITIALLVFIAPHNEPAPRQQVPPLEKPGNENRAKPAKKERGLPVSRRKRRHQRPEERRGIDRKRRLLRARIVESEGAWDDRGEEKPPSKARGGLRRPTTLC